MSESTTETAERITEAVQAALGTEKLPISAEEAAAKARAVYLTWRNSCLQNLTPDAFAKVEEQSGALVAAIAAALTT